MAELWTHPSPAGTGNLAKMFKGEYKGKAMEMTFDTNVTGLLGASFGARQA